ncbi:MAG: DUF378 domain-containing protein [Bauldia sp.]|nr:DUF378 domain-containing protein [Bauldia sp.]
MRALDIITLIIVIIGALNWGLIALFDFNVVTSIFGEGTDGMSTVSKIVYIIVGVSALYQLIPLARMLSPRSA